MDDGHRSASNPPDEPRWRQVLDTVQGVLITLSMLVSLGAGVYVIQAQRDVNALIGCFKGYTASYNEAQKKRLAASVVLEDARKVTSVRALAFSEAVDALYARADPGGLALKRANRLWRDALRAEKAANEARDRVQKDNPYPRPCGPGS